MVCPSCSRFYLCGIIKLCPVKHFIYISYQKFSDVGMFLSEISVYLECSMNCEDNFPYMLDKKFVHIQQNVFLYRESLWKTHINYYRFCLGLFITKYYPLQANSFLLFYNIVLQRKHAIFNLLQNIAKSLSLAVSFWDMDLRWLYSMWYT